MNLTADHAIPPATLGFVQALVSALPRRHRVSAAGFMAELVIHTLQMVNVDGKNRERLSRNRPQDAVEFTTVLEAGETVRGRKLGHPERLVAQRSLRVQPCDEVSRVGPDVGDG